MQGFTLLELLVAMAIAAILTAFAVPRYQEYRQRAFDLRAQFDLHNVAQAEEVYYMDNEEYLSCTDEGCTALPGVVRLSSGVRLSIVAEEDSFRGSASNLKGSGKVFNYDSAEGGMLESAAN